MRPPCVKVSKGAKIRNRYNQVPHLTQDTNGKVTNSQKTPQTRAKRPAPPPQQATTKHTQTDAHRHSKHKTEQKHKRSTALERPAKHPTGGPKPAQRRQPHPQLRCGPRHTDTRPARSDVKLVKDRLDVDRRLTMHELCSELDMGYGTVHRISKDEINMSRVSARWVPRLLKNHEMERRVMDPKTL